MTADQLGLWAGLVLTLMVFSYLLGDNVLYRLAVFVFVGLAAGFTVVVTVESVLLPWLHSTLLAPDATAGVRVLGALPLLFGFLLLVRTSPRLGRLGNLALALVIAVGTAVAVAGAVAGTLVPLAASTGAAPAGDRLNGFLLVLGVVCALIYFQYSARGTADAPRMGVVARVFGTAGKGVIVVALAALYAGAILTGLTIFGERLAFIVARLGGG